MSEFTGYLFKHRHPTGEETPDVTTRIRVGNDVNLSQLFDAFHGLVIAAGFSEFTWRKCLRELASEAVESFQEDKRMEEPASADGSE